MALLSAAASAAFLAPASHPVDGHRRIASTAGSALLPTTAAQNRGALRRSCCYAVGVVGALAAALTQHRDRRSTRRRFAVARRAAVKEANFDVPGIGARGVNMKPEWMQQIGKDMPDMENMPEDMQYTGITEFPTRYVCWLTRKATIPAILKAWQEDKSCTDEQKAIMEKVAKMEIPKGWACWALAEESMSEKGPGFYLLPPPGAEPQVLVLLEAVDGTKNLIHHVCAKPDALGLNVENAVNDWLDSQFPKECVVRQPEEFKAFKIELDSEDQGEGSSVKVSKGL
eukprot:TRINITY_DN101812_c0_g1_i1.p1 TRINITY_DN101812_c0_g1~~TRINITY_DN101812_c0_g1_i1.p1  ORF type:complete len:285 (-),score=73.55 TRINITY_DN101812_c0_g1_i1:72-926(-)